MDPRSTNCASHLWHQVVRLRRIVARGDKWGFLFYLYPSIKSLEKKMMEYVRYWEYGENVNKKEYFYS